MKMEKYYCKKCGTTRSEPLPEDPFGFGYNWVCPRCKTARYVDRSKLDSDEPCEN